MPHFEVLVFFPSVPDLRVRQKGPDAFQLTELVQLAVRTCLGALKNNTETAEGRGKLPTYPANRTSQLTACVLSRLLPDMSFLNPRYQCNL